MFADEDDAKTIKTKAKRLVKFSDGRVHIITY